MKFRSSDFEIMDDSELDSPDLYKTLDQLDIINKWIGGSQHLINCVLCEIRKRIEIDNTVNVLDMGSGSGWLLRQIEMKLSKFERKRVNLFGIDANKHIIDYAKKRNGESEVQFIHGKCVIQFC